VFRWTEENNAFLLDNLDKPYAWLADHFGISVGAVKGRIQRLKREGVIRSTSKKTLVKK
jgi:DNA-binding Lrp family transcriptional regulator